MVNFVCMVHEALLEIKARDTSLDLFFESTRNDWVWQFHYVPRKTEVENTLKSTYAGITIPSDANIETYLSLLYSTGPRGGINPKNLPNVQDWFPLFDLLCALDSQVASLSSEAEQKEEDNTNDVYDNWLKRVKTSGGIPIEFDPLSTKGRILKTTILQGVNLGELRIDRLKNQNMSFHATVETLLEAMTNATSKVLPGQSSIFPQKIAKFFDQNGDTIIHNILHNVSGIIAGSITVDKKIDEIFTYAASTKLVNISLSLYQLYKREINEITKSIIFLVDPTTPVTAAVTTTTTTSLTGLREFADNLLEDVREQLYQNTKLYDAYIGMPEDTNAVYVDYKPYLDAAFMAKGITKSLTEFVDKKAPPLTNLPFKVDPTKNDDWNFVYSISKLLVASKGDNTEAKNVYTALTDLGNHIKAQEPRDKLGGAAKIATGLTLGVKNMGD